MKAKAQAHSNVAFIKYWGRKDEELRLPENGSISMNLSNLVTTTSVEFDKNFDNDTLTINGRVEYAEKVSKHLDRIRKIAGKSLHAKIVSENNFPSSAGLSSSASGFAALTLASCSALDLDLSEKELSILARQGSGSACRSIPDGFVEWLDGETSDTSYACSLFPADYFEIADIVVIVDSEKKFLSTSEGQKSARTSPFFNERISKIPDKLKLIKELIEEKNFTRFGELIEQEALEFHSILLTSNPPLIYWRPETIEVITNIWKLRKAGIESYFTINTGHDVHIICRKSDVGNVSEKLKNLDFVREVIINYPSNGARVL